MKRIISTLVLGLSLAVSVMAQSTASVQVVPEKLTRQQLQSLVTTAKTSAEHQRIANYYEAKAQRLVVESQEHAMMAEQYKKNIITASGKFSTGTVNHCEYIAESLKQDAAKAQELANLHQEMARTSAR
jgi:hypothetical protein